MKWIKKGLIFEPPKNLGWMVSHAANPVAEHLGGDLYRVYFSGRDERNRASIGFVEFDIIHPEKIINISSKPVVSPGAIGTFDDSGTSMGCIVRHGDTRYLYYLGWNLGITVPWRNSIGLLTSEGNSPFTRFSNAPVLDRSGVDPFSISYPWVLKEDNKWRMWYGSNLKWGSMQEDMAHLLKYAESSDGIRWFPTGEISLDFKGDNEYAMSKPCVVKERGVYKMWYSYRGESYRIGYAESKDGLQWERKDEEAGIDVSETGWDSEMICYPHVFEHNGEKYMLYNGNSYGKSGIGLAVLAREE
jgi:predicted GH43/DUF377 family glycosyl hydrolase